MFLVTMSHTFSEVLLFMGYNFFVVSLGYIYYLAHSFSNPIISRVTSNIQVDSGERTLTSPEGKRVKLIY